MLFLIKEKRNHPSLIHPKQGRLAKVYFAYIQVISHFRTRNSIDNMRKISTLFLLILLSIGQTSCQNRKVKIVYENDSIENPTELNAVKKYILKPNIVII